MIQITTFEELDKKIINKGGISAGELVLTCSYHNAGRSMLAEFLILSHQLYESQQEKLKSQDIDDV
jgi:archaellum biogenesis ATPase FlaH